MSTYTYGLNKVKKENRTHYMRTELESLTTLQLREICYVEKIAVGMGYRLNRDFMIETILKYRGYNNHKFIVEYEEAKYKKFKEKILNYVAIRDNNAYSLPTKINIFSGNCLTEDDNVKIESREYNHEANALLLDSNNVVRGIFNIKNINDTYYLTYAKDLIDNDLEEGVYKNFSLGIFTEKSSRYAYDYYNEFVEEKTERLPSENTKLYDSPTKINMTLVNISELSVNKVVTSDNVLVIDFGTSNTSVGVYDKGEIKEVKFSKVEKDTINFTEIIPTVVGITSCANDNIQYEFGYEALAGASKNSYNVPHSVFYGIKKWVNNYLKDEEITDKSGNHKIVRRKEILKAYLLYIIECAEIAHKCKYKKIHITSPIKQKNQFLQMYQDVLEDYNYEIEIINALDEGVAVLYNSISNQILKGNFENDRVYKALVIDCGGGTTDLTSCNYKINDEEITYDLEIVTTYANGETNFGGNSLTYRVFQYLKVLFANYYIENKYVFAESLFETDTQGVYRFVDEFGLDKFYEELEVEYENAEEYIPTKYNEYKYLSPEEFMKIRSNFYFLWNLAERIKLQFYQTLSRNITDFHEKGLKIDQLEKKIVSEESWRINILQDGVFKLQTKAPQVAISKEEVDLLIKGDIYYVVKKFIEPLFENGELDNFDMIKLTGQTCKIDIFRDALKEFIAGKFIQTNSKDKQLKNFKLGCLEGAIKYQNAYKIGKIAPHLKNESPVTPYELVGYAHNGDEIVLMSNLTSLMKTYGYISKNINTKLVELSLKNAEGKIVHRYEFSTDFNNYTRTNYSEIHREYGDKILQTEVDQIREREIKIFTLSYDDKWGFYIVPIARNENDEIYIGEKIYYPFENDEWEVNYFDGTK